MTSVDPGRENAWSRIRLQLRRFDLFLVVTFAIFVAIYLSQILLIIVLPYVLFLLQRSFGATRRKRAIRARGTDVSRRTYVVPRDLPPVVSSFVGREWEIDGARSHLQAAGVSGAKLVIVYGPAGIGKTAFALHTAHRLVDRFPDGQLFASVSALTELHGNSLAAIRHDVLGRFITGLRGPGDDIPADRIRRIVRYRQLIRARPRVLIVLEDVVDVQVLDGLLPDGDEWGAIVTTCATDSSSEPEDTRLIKTFAPRVETLSISLAPLGKGESVRLLRLAVGDDRVGREPHEARRIVDATAGHPLSLQSAAASLAALPHTSLAAALRADTDQVRPVSPAGAGPFALSVELLTDEEQRAFRLIGLLGRVFPGWKLAALIEADEREATRLADRLLYAGLLERTNTDVAGTPMFTVPELVHTSAKALIHTAVPDSERYRLAQLLRDGEARRTRHRSMAELKTAVFVPFLRGEMNAAIVGARGAVARARDSNDRAAEALALAAFAEIRTELGSFDVARELATSAIQLQEIEGRVRAQRCLGRMHRRLRQLGEADRVLRQALRAVPNSDPSEKIRLLRELAVVQALAKSPDAAVQTVENAFQLCAKRPQGGPQHIPGLHWARSVIYMTNGDFDEAADSVLQGEEAAAELGQILWSGWLKHRHSFVKLEAGDHPGARTVAYVGLELFGRMDNPYGKAHCWLLVGRSYLADDRPDEALPILEESVGNFLKCGDRWAEAEATRWLARTHSRLGSVSVAERLLHTAQQWFQTLGDKESSSRIGAELASISPAPPGVGNRRSSEEPRA